RAPEPGAPFVPQHLHPDTACFEVTARPTRSLLLFWPHDATLFFGTLPLGASHPQPLGTWLFEIENYLVHGAVAWVVVLMNIVMTAFFIPHLLRKGAVDLLLVRPLHRVRLLLYKYVSGIVFMFVNFSVLIGALWGVIGLRTGVWAPGFLLSV